jgi:hypothetical protein
VAERNAPDEENRRGAGLLLLGAMVGLLMATLGLLELPRAPSRQTNSPEIAARVGDRVIRRADYARVLAGVASDLRRPVDTDMRRHVLERMIDEELLVQRALELGLAQVDRRVRGELTSSMIDSIVAEVGNEPPEMADVVRHYDENLDFFTRPGRLRARRIHFSKGRDGQDARGTALERAQAASEQLRAGAVPDEVEARWGDRQVSALPDALLPPVKVRDYVGPGLLTVMETLVTGVWSTPQESANSVALVAVLEREPAVVPSLAEIESLVQQDLERRRGDEALRHYLDELRRATEITIDERLFSETDSPRHSAGSSH